MRVFVLQDHFFGFGTDTLGLTGCQNFKLRILYILYRIIIQGLSNIYNILNSDIFHTALKLSGIHLIYKFIVVKYCSRNILFQLYYILMDLGPVLICSVPNEAVYYFHYTTTGHWSWSCHYTYSPGKVLR